jgi:hypothetical protein
LGKSNVLKYLTNSAKMMNDRDIVPLVVRKAGERLTADNTHDSEWKSMPPVIIDNSGPGKLRKCTLK